VIHPKSIQIHNTRPFAALNEKQMAGLWLTRSREEREGKAKTGFLRVLSARMGRLQDAERPKYTPRRSRRKPGKPFDPNDLHLAPFPCIKIGVGVGIAAGVERVFGTGS
jgi:hypothetical protein